MSDEDWRPGASLDVLKQSALMRASIRHFMQERDVLEVVTPALSQAATTDPNIHSFQVGSRYLHTSPEFPMKRLLAAYSTDIYQIATVFRDGEAGRFHNAEFSMLEWYRVGMNHIDLMSDVDDLLEALFALFNRQWQKTETLLYTDAVTNVCQCSFNEVDVAMIERVFQQHGRSYPKAIGNELDAAMDLLMDEFVISKFADNHATYVVDYPASQAALARVTKDHNGVSVAERFELYWGPLELANGFHELNDAGEQRGRFEHENRARTARAQVMVPLDEMLLKALKSGLPDCAGVALGLDRLAMLLCEATHIDAVQAFSGNRA